MERIQPFLEFLVFSSLAGLAGTAMMTYCMHLVTRSGVANADIVVAIGSFFTGSRENAKSVGVVLHTLSGIVFGILYTLMFGVMAADSVFSFLFVGAGLGLLQGFVLSFLLIILLAEHHPLQEFREAGPGAAVAHIIGVIIFGLVVGASIWFSGFRFM